jgi:hypothetical protein
MEVASVSGSGEIWQAEQTGRLKLYLPRTALVAPAGASVKRVVDIFGMSTFPCKSGFARVAWPEHQRNATTNEMLVGIVALRKEAALFEVDK